MAERVLIASAVYPQPDDIAREFAASLEVCGAQDTDVCVLFAVEAGTDLDPFLPRPDSTVSVEVHHAENGVSGPALRQVMFDSAGFREDCSVVAFLDCDDRVRPNAPALYRTALETADIAYGDMQLVDRTGNCLSDTLYGGCEVPDTIADSKEITFRNPLGLSNTAVRRKTLRDLRPEVPHEITAVDWWLFTMLIDAGASAKRTRGLVADYRQYSGNTLGKKGIASIEDLRTRLTIAEQHYRALPKNLERQRALDLLMVCREKIAQSPNAVERALLQDPSPTLWHESIFRVAASIETHVTKNTLARSGL